MTQAIRWRQRTCAAIAVASAAAAIVLVACSQPPAGASLPAASTSSAPAAVAERRRTADLLGNYQLVDAERRRFRIPVERASALVVDEPELLRPATAATSASAPATEPASQPARSR